MKPFKASKRFIAGAVCPECGATDSLRFWRDEQNRERRDCIDCGWQEALDLKVDQTTAPVRLITP